MPPGTQTSMYIKRVFMYPSLTIAKMYQFSQIERIAKWRFDSPSMVSTALRRVGCRGEHAGRESAESFSGAPAPPRPARSALHRHLCAPRRLCTRCASLFAFNVTPPNRCRACKGGSSSRQNYGNSMNRMAPLESAMHCTAGDHD